MIRIAVCDDDPQELETTCRLLHAVTGQRGADEVQIYPFAHADELLTHMEQHDGFDIFILDVMMPDTSGIALGHEIRHSPSASEIIYVSQSKEYAIAAYGVEALRYLVKPLTEEILQEALSRACEKIVQARNCPTLIKSTSGGVLRLQVRDIVCIENRKNHQYVLMKDGATHKLHEKLASLFSELSPYPCFIMPRHSYIVNMDYIAKIDKKDIYLRNGIRIPLVKNSYLRIKQQVLDYAFSEVST